MPSIDQIVEEIRTAIYGRDVRENIALGIEKCYDDSQENVKKSDIANNLTTTAAGKVLDARQGKIISNNLGDIRNTKLDKSDVVNNFTTTSLGKALDATLGKRLNDITVQAGLISITSDNKINICNGDLDNLPNNRIYAVAGSAYPMEHGPFDVATLFGIYTFGKYGDSRSAGDLQIAVLGGVGNPSAKTAIRMYHDIWSNWRQIVNDTDIANNLTTTAAGKVLDARQGKALNDIANDINEKVDALCVKGTAINIDNNNKATICNGDLNNLPNNKIYGIANNAVLTNDPVSGSGFHSIYTFGKMVERSGGDLQIIVRGKTTSDSSSIANTIYVRMWHTDWSNWKEIYTSGNLNPDLFVQGSLTGITADNKEEICGGDIDNLPNNRIYSVGGSAAPIAHDPFGLSVMFGIYTFGKYSVRTGGDCQIAILGGLETVATKIAIRMYHSFWGDWKYISTNDDLNNLVANGVESKQLELVGYTFHTGAFNVITGEYNTENVLFKHLEYALNGEKVLYIGGYQYGANYRAWAFLNSYNAVIKKSDYVAGAASIERIETVIVPDDATKLIVNIRDTQPGSDNTTYPSFIYKYSTTELYSPEVKTEVKDAGGKLVFGKLYRANRQENDGNVAYMYRVLNISGGETLYVSGLWTSVNYPLCMFFDADDNLLYNPYISYGSAATIVHDFKVVAPSTARKIIVNGWQGDAFGGPCTPIVKKVIKTSSNTVHSHIDNTLRQKSINLEYLFPDIHYEYVMGKDGNLSENNTRYRYASISVEPGKTYYISGRNYTRNWPLYIFKNGNGDVCQWADPTVFAESTRYFDVKIEAPLDATTLYVNSLDNSDCAVKVEGSSSLIDVLKYREPINIYNSRTVINEITSDFVDGAWVYNAKKAEDLLSRFTYAYAMMLHRIMTTYPLATVIVCTNNECERITSKVGAPDINALGESITEYNENIIRIANIFGAIVVDHHSCGITYYNLSEYMQDYASSTGFGLHPNAAGMNLIAAKTTADLKNFEWTGKKVSIFGDSISTYNGTGSTNNQYPSGDITNVNQMWWYKSCITDLGMTLLTNASGGGRTVSTFREGIAGRPKSGVNQDAINTLKVGTTLPDVIIIKQGTNDFGNVGISNNLDLNGHYHFGGL